MRVGHWSWAYARAKARVAWFQWRRRDAPWLTADAVRRIEAWLRPEHRVLEWGAGRSTAWFARGARHVTSIEHDPAWHARVSGILKAGKLDNVDLRLQPVDEPGYVEAAGPGDAFDLVLVDGRRRDACALRGVEWIAPGGWLIIDDAERYLPLRLRPPSLPPTPPDLRGRADGAATPVWTEVVDKLGDWALTWTSDGVSDTVLWQRPSDARQTRQGERDTNE